MERVDERMNITEVHLKDVVKKSVDLEEWKLAKYERQGF